MMDSKHFFLRQDLFNPTNTADIAGHSEESGKYIWIAGTAFRDPPSVFRLMLDYQYGTAMPDFFDTTVPVMSMRLLNALKELGVTNLDAYPVVLIDPIDGAETNGYMAINLIGEIDAIDWSRTKHRMRFSKPIAIGAIHLLSEATNKKNAFRLAHGPGFIVVAKHIALTLMKMNLKEVLLQPLNEYNGT